MPPTSKDRVLVASADEREVTTWVGHLAGDDALSAAATAGSGREVVQHLQTAAHLPALLLIDMKLIAEDDFSLLRTLKNTPRWQVLPVVVLATLHDIALITRCYELQANACIVKPATESELQVIIEKAKRFWLVISASPVAGGRLK